MDIETSENVQSTSGKAIRLSDVKKKAGCLSKPKNEATHSWTDDEINVLIDAWAEHEIFTIKSTRAILIGIYGKNC